MGAPILLIHGWAGSFDLTWRKSGLVELLEEAGRRVIPFDLPGHGAAPKSHDPADYRDLSGAVLGAISNESCVDAVGFSLGGLTLLEAMTIQPERFRRSIIVGIGDGIFLPHDPVDTELIIAGLEGRADPTEKTARLFGRIGNVQPNDPRALAAVLRRPRSMVVTEESLSRVAAPVLLLLGDSDFSLPADRLHNAIRNSQLKIIKGADHFRTPESFEFLELVIRFLET